MDSFLMKDHIHYCNDCNDVQARVAVSQERAMVNK